MTNIGIITGKGDLPLIVGQNLIKKNYNVTFFLIKDCYKKNNYSKYNTVEIKLNSLKIILNLFYQNKIEKIIMLGSVNRPSLKDIKFDLETIKLIKNYFLENKGDDQLLIYIQKFFEKKGFSLFNWTYFCKDLFVDKKNLTKKTPSNKAILNLKKGFECFQKFGKTDIGQSIIIQNQIILGLEAAEGTDELIKRCFNYKKKGDKGILIKLSKYNQSKLIDIPTIGIKTLELLNKFNYEGIYLELNKCLIINQEEVINYANKNNLFISTLSKN